MKEMGWSFADYQQAPAHLIEQIWAFMATEAKVQTDAFKKHSNKR